MRGWTETTQKSVPRDENLPTVYMRSLLIKATIYAHEGRGVGIYGILGAFLSV